MARNFFDLFTGGGARWGGTKTACIPDADDEPVSASAGGTSFASGDDTATDGKVFLKMIDLGPLTIVLGASAFKAAAEGGATYTAADSFAEAEGCDILLKGGGDTMTMTAGGDIIGATSWSGIFAIDIEAVDYADGPRVLDFTPDEPPDLAIDEPADLPGGNTATVDVQASAEGAATAVEVGVNVLTLDQMSSVDAWAWGEIG